MRSAPNAARPTTRSLGSWPPGKVCLREDGHELRMTPRRKVIVSMAIALVVTVLAAALAAPLLARSHDDNTIACLLFPYALLFAYITDGNLLWTAIGLLQFPIYGAIYAHAWIHGFEGNVLLRIAVPHLLSGLGCSWL